MIESKLRGRIQEYRWVVEWPDQTVQEEVDGELRDVTVVGGREMFATWREATNLAETLIRWWPGLRVSILSIEQADLRPMRVIAARGEKPTTATKSKKAPKTVLAVAEG